MYILHSTASVESSLTDASIRCSLTRDSEALLKPANKRCLPAEQTYHHSGNIPDTKTISVRRYNQQLRLDCSFKVELLCDNSYCELLFFTYNRTLTQERMYASLR